MRGLTTAVGALMVMGLASSGVASAQAPPPKEANKRLVDPPRRTLEFSFGTSQLFETEQAFELERDTDILPTTSALFIAELSLTPELGLVSFFNLPLTPIRSLTPQGRIETSFAAPSLALGLTWTPLSWAFRAQSRVELQVAMLGGWVVEINGRFFPLTAARVRILQDEGFALYLGTAFAFRLDTTALIYGIGHRF